MGLFGNTEKAKARRLSKILGYTRDDDKKTLDQLEQEFGAKVRALPTDYTQKDIKRIVKEEKGDTLDSLIFNPTVQDEAGNFVRTDIPDVDINVPIDERPELPPGAFYGDDTEARDEQIIRATLGLGPDEQVPLNYDGTNPTISLQQQADFQRFLDERNFRENKMPAIMERLNATNFDARDITPKVDMEIMPINEAGTESTDQFFSQLASEAQLDREANLSPGEILRRNVLSSIGEEPELDEARLKRAKTRALVNAFGNLLQAGVGLGTMQSGGYFQAKPIDNSQALAGLEGVYDDYYKELADYRDRKNETMLKLAQLDASDEQRRIDREAKEKENALRREENQLDRESRERIAEENRQTQLEIASARADAEKETLATRFKNEKDLLELKLDAEDKIRNASDTDSKRKFINDQQRNLNTQYANTLKSLQEIYDQINEGTKSDVELKRLEEEGVALQNTLKILEGEIKTFRGYADELITTGTITLESDTEKQNNEISEAENTTIQALQDEVAKLKEQLVDRNLDTNRFNDQNLYNEAEESINRLSEKLNLTETPAFKNLESFELNNDEDVKKLISIIDQVYPGGEYNPQKQGELFGAGRSKQDLDKLKQSLETYLEARARLRKVES